MASINRLRREIISEINQKQIVKKEFVLKVLSSKRLLVDHQEIVEESLDDLLQKNSSSKEIFTFMKTAGVLATSYVIFVHLKQNYRFLIPSIAGVMPIIYFKKLVNVKQNEILESKLSDFTNSLDNFESAVKKNKTFLSEAQMMKSSAQILQRYDKDNRIPQNLVTSIKSVIDSLYTFVKLLETFEVSERLGLIYEPFENLQDCELMTLDLEGEIDPKVIKDFFNVFAYVQSQVLLRFTLITLTNIDDSKMILRRKIDAVTEVVKAETENISKFLRIVESATKQQGQVDVEALMTMPMELREVRTGSIKFAAKILTVTMQCQHLEELVLRFAEKFEHPDNKKVEEILETMKAVENELSLSLDEHKRIAILFQKFLNIEIEEAKEVEKSQDSKSIVSDENVKKISEDDVMPHTDDFFFVDGTTEEIAEEQQPETIEEVNSKLAKKYFKPVLVQLKERIEVIGEDMKEREKKVLKAKGIEISEDLEVPKLPSDDEGDSGSDDERDRRRKFRRNEEKFSGNREFLESKQPINIFGSTGFPFPLPSQPLDEDVLE